MRQDAATILEEAGVTPDAYCFGNTKVFLRTSNPNPKPKPKPKPKPEPNPNPNRNPKTPKPLVFKYYKLSKM